MKKRLTPVGVLSLLAVCLLCSSLASAAGSLGWNADALAREMQAGEKLPALPEGVAELNFSEMFKTPVGPRGLEMTDRLLSLDGKRVRILGYMVRQTKPSPGIAILAPFNFSTNENEYSLADDIPPSVIFVEVPRYADLAVPHTRGPLLLTGTLSVGRREEKDGRVSLIRLTMDAE